MLKTQHPYAGNENLIKTYSDEGYYLIQNETGRRYRIAIDVYPCRFTYTESTEKAPKLQREYKKGGM